MGAWSPQTLRVARPSAERLSEVGTVPMHAPVLSDGTERFPRAVLGLICYKWGPGRPCVTRSLARSYSVLIIGVVRHNFLFFATIDANVAAVNGFEYMPVAIEKDSLTLGPKMGTLIKRMSRNREGESFDKELERLYGFRDGTWSAPVADRYWRARLVISVVKARERAVDNFIQGTKAWGDNLL